MDIEQEFGTAILDGIQQPFIHKPELYRTESLGQLYDFFFLHCPSV